MNAPDIVYNKNRMTSFSGYATGRSKLFGNRYTITADFIQTDVFKIQNTFFIKSIFDLPPAVNGVIDLQPNTNLFILSDVNLEGNRLRCLGNVSIHGFSSETSSLYSDLPDGTALLNSAFTLPIQNITLGCSTNAFVLDLDSDGSNGIDISNVNFGSQTLACGAIGTIANYANFAAFNCALIGTTLTDGFCFHGTFDTIAFNQCLFTHKTRAIILEATLTITRRFRAIYSSFVTVAPNIGIEVEVGSTIPTEGVILDTVNFSGGGTYLLGIDSSVNLSLFTNCVGINNSANQGSLSMSNNLTDTVITVQGTYYKILGTTTASPENQKFVATNNRLTYTGVLTDTYFYTSTFTLTTTNNQNIEVALYKNGVFVVSTPLFSDGNGVSINSSIGTLIPLTTNDYLELFVRNNTSSANIRATYLVASTFRIGT